MAANRAMALKSIYLHHRTLDYFLCHQLLTEQCKAVPVVPICGTLESAALTQSSARALHFSMASCNLQFWRKPSHTAHPS